VITKLLNFNRYLQPVYKFTIYVYVYLFVLLSVCIIICVYVCFILYIIFREILNVIL